MAWTDSDEVSFSASPGVSPGASPGLSPRRTSLMLKPVGATCNLACDYCYYLPVAESYAAPAKRMSLDMLDNILAGYLPGAADQVTISWQGGEPTLAGLPWFKRMIEIVEKHRRPGQTVSHCLQTNGTLLTDDWGAFLHQHQFLVGLSLDGLSRDHDHYRQDLQHRGTYQGVLAGRAILQKRQVEHNLLVVLNDRNVERPHEVWRNLIALRADWLQFIPAVEWTRDPIADDDTAWRTADFSPTGEAYGRFLCHIFDEWFTRHRHRVSVRMFDAILSILAHGRSTECTYSDTCAGQLTLEHDGQVYGCDHFVEPAWKLGQVSPPIPLTRDGQPLTHPCRDHGRGEDADAPLDRGWMQRLEASRFEAFGRRKQDLDASCRSCEYRRVCQGGCPKHRPARGDLPGPSVLCDGYRAFFAHALPRLEWLAGHIRRGQIPPAQAPDSVMPRCVRKRSPRTRKKRR